MTESYHQERLEIIGNNLEQEEAWDDELLDALIPERSLYATPITLDIGDIPFDEFETEAPFGNYTITQMRPKTARRHFAVFGSKARKPEHFNPWDKRGQPEIDEYDRANLPQPFIDEPYAHLVSSFLVEYEDEDGKVTRYHAPAIDIDHRVGIRETSPGKFHLFIDKPIEESKYFQLLDLLADPEIGIVEEGYAKASRKRGASYLRLPDVEKDYPGKPARPLQEVIEDRLRALRYLPVEEMRAIAGDD